MLQELKEELAARNARLVAVSKTKPEADILRIYNEGQRLFGENRVQEMAAKHEALPKDIEWHLIGRLQTNKVKYIAEFVGMIHSVDSLKLLKEINKQAAKHNRVIDVLLQFHIAQEMTKAGFDLSTVRQVLSSEAFQELGHINICGVMGMATFTDDETQVRKEFQHLRSIFEELKQDFFADQPGFKEISMGMSGDYQIAIEEGSTMVRIGSLIFGARNYG